MRKDGRLSLSKFLYSINFFYSRCFVCLRLTVFLSLKRFSTLKYWCYCLFIISLLLIRFSLVYNISIELFCWLIEIWVEIGSFKLWKNVVYMFQFRCWCQGTCEKCEFKLMKCLIYLAWGVLTHLYVNCIDYLVGKVLVDLLLLVIFLLVSRIEIESQHSKI